MPVILPVRPPSPFSTVSCLVHFWLGKLLIAQPAPASLSPSLSRSPPGNCLLTPWKALWYSFVAARKSRQFAASASELAEATCLKCLWQPPPLPPSPLLPQLAPAVLPTYSLSLSLFPFAEYNERICIWRNLAWYAWQSQLHSPPLLLSLSHHTHTTLVCFQAQEFSFIHFHISHSLALLPFALKCDFSLDFLIMRQWWSRHSTVSQSALAVRQANNNNVERYKQNTPTWALYSACKQAETVAFCRNVPRNEPEAKQKS